MSYRAVIGLNLGASKAGQTLLGQLITTSGTTYGNAIYDYFYDLGNGQFSFDYSNYPDGFRGSLIIYPSGNIYTSGYLVVGLNPETLEYIDQKISTIPVSIDSYLSSIHGSGSWESLAAALDNYEIDFYTKDQNNDVVGGAIIAIYPSGSNSLMSYGVTNGSTGKASFNLDNGQYRVDAYKHACLSFDNPLYITVSGSAAVYTINGTLYTTTAPYGSGLVRIYAYLTDLGLTTDSDNCADMLVKPSGTTNFGSFLVTDKPIRAESDSSGYIYADIAPDTEIRVRIPRAGFDHFMRTPASGVFNLATLI